MYFIELRIKLGGKVFWPEPLFRSALRPNLKQVFRSNEAAKFGRHKVTTANHYVRLRSCFLWNGLLIPTQVLMIDTDRPVVFNPVAPMTFSAP